MSGKRVKIIKKIVKDYILKNYIVTSKNTTIFNREARRQWSEKGVIDLSIITVRK